MKFKKDGDGEMCAKLPINFSVSKDHVHAAIGVLLGGGVRPAEIKRTTVIDRIRLLFCEYGDHGGDNWPKVSDEISGQAMTMLAVLFPELME